MGGTIDTKYAGALIALALFGGIMACFATYSEAVKYRDEAWRDTLRDSGFILLVRYNEITGEKVIKIERAGK